MSLAVLVPVLGRPHRVRPTLAGFAPHSVYFIPNPEDKDEIAAIKQAGGTILLTSTGNYAQKINAAIKLTTEPLIFLGADDLEPRPGWFDVAARYIKQGAQVVGINDMISRSRSDHSTHFVLTREYSELRIITGEPGPLCEIYDHSCIDDELMATARYRGVYAYAEDAQIKHLHPDMGTAPSDSTYVKGRSHIRDDRRLWKSRKYWYIEQGQGQ